MVACQGPPTSGDCKKFIVGYTFDPVSNSCKEFGNGGCSMTANGFGKIEDCEATCNPVQPCQGPPTSGNCKKLFKGFTFDPVSMKCKKFSAGGCDMTANGFAKKKDCKATCSKYIL